MNATISWVIVCSVVAIIFIIRAAIKSKGKCWTRMAAPRRPPLSRYESDFPSLMGEFNVIHSDRIAQALRREGYKGDNL